MWELLQEFETEEDFSSGSATCAYSSSQKFHFLNLYIEFWLKEKEKRNYIQNLLGGLIDWLVN